MTTREKAQSILLAGVGGQGILKASDIICTAIMYEGLDVKKSEVHGMAQRGGSVTSHVRYGEKVFSPVAARGEVDVFASFELLESLRYIEYLKHSSKVILNNFRVNPPAVNLGVMDYPENVPQLWRERVAQVGVVDARSMAKEAGNFRAENVVMVGVLARMLPVKKETWERVLEEFFPGTLKDVNLKAFYLGYRFSPA